MELITQYFTDLTPIQLEQFRMLEPLYKEWNARINVISRKDEGNFYERHVLHSLGIAKVIQFTSGTKILDIGTGGGFPGIPLAVLFPDAQFTLVDSIGKKVKVVNEVASALALRNVTGIHERAEKVPGKFDFIVSRAVTAMPAFLPWTKGKFEQKNNHPTFKNGIFYLKGGDLAEELSGIKRPMTIFPLTDYFEGDFFETKKVVYVQMNP
jgi:16S rRNA (guanine527-N7)-methyltransferase